MQVVVNLGDIPLAKRSRFLGLFIKPVLDALVEINRFYLRTHHVPELYRARVRYRPEPDDGTPEEFAAIPKILSRGWGDCDDLAPWRVAELPHPGAGTRFMLVGPPSRASRACTTSPSGPKAWFGVSSAQNHAGQGAGRQNAARRKVAAWTSSRVLLAERGTTTLRACSEISGPRLTAPRNARLPRKLRSPFGPVSLSTAGPNSQPATSGFLQAGLRRRTATNVRSARDARPRP